MKRKRTDTDSPFDAKYSAKVIEHSEYIDITPYQNEGDPCYGGNTGETEYENYIKDEEQEKRERKR